MLAVGATPLSMAMFFKVFEQALENFNTAKIFNIPTKIEKVFAVEH